MQQSEASLLYREVALEEVLQLHLGVIFFEAKPVHI
jgi:hypothetical protein